MPMHTELEDEILTAIRRIVRAIDLHSRKLVEQAGLTGPQLATLRTAMRLGPVSIGSLARSVQLGQPTVSGILDRLARRGLVRRDRSNTDRRSVVITVTPAGAQALQDTPSLLQDRFASELEKLEDWERHQVLSVLQRIASMMAAEDLDASPHLVTGSVAGGIREAAPAETSGEAGQSGEPSA